MITFCEKEELSPAWKLSCSYNCRRRLSTRQIDNLVVPGWRRIETEFRGTLRKNGKQWRLDGHRKLPIRRSGINSGDRRQAAGANPRERNRRPRNAAQA